MQTDFRYGCTPLFVHPACQFTGKERDTESGNDYFGARYYSSSIGRWLSPDWSAQAEPVPYAKLDDPQSLNLYGYVDNGPVDKQDPDGHLLTLQNYNSWGNGLHGQISTAIQESEDVAEEMMFQAAQEAAKQQAQQQVSQNGIDFIKGQEGWNGTVDKKTGLTYAKDDGFGNGTIGWGHNCGKCADFAGGITKAQGDALLTQDLGRFEGAVNGLGANLSQQQFDGLVSFAFNVKSYQGSTLMHNTAAGLPVTEANFTAYGNARNAQHVLVPVPGLMRRREQEWDVYANGDYSGRP
jgi:RHS repeat-associated protein